MTYIKFRIVVLAAVALCASSAMAADIVGSVLDPVNAPVPGAKIVAKDLAGKTVGSAVADAKGAYEIRDVAPGNYAFTIDPTSQGFKRGKSEASLTAKGLTLDWMVSKTADSLAMAKETPEVSFLARDPFGLTVAQAIGVGAGGLAVAGIGTVVGLSSAGVMGSSSHLASPSM